VQTHEIKRDLLSANSNY